MDSKNKSFLNDLDSHVHWAIQTSTNMFEQMARLQELINDYRFECDEDFLELKKQITLFPGANPWTREELLEKIEDFPTLIGVKDMVDSEIYNSKTTLNKYFLQGKIPFEVYSRSGNRRFFIKEKLLEYINENFS